MTLAVDPALERGGTGPRLVLWPKRLLFVGYGLGAWTLAQGAQLPRAQAIVLVLAPLLAADALLRHLMVRQLKRFERELTARLQRKQLDGLLPLYREQRLLRFAAPRHEMLGKLGLIYRKLENHAAAARAYREAFDDAPVKARPLLARWLADAHYALERFEEAERYYRASQDDDNFNAGVRARLARLIMQRGGDGVEAERLMRQAVDAVQGQPGCGGLRCQLVQLLAERGDVDEARWQLQLAEEELAGGGAEAEPQLARARAALARLETAASG